MRKRAEQEAETRRRITKVVVELHRTVGPVNTKVTDVAERAGVSRMTVYNHFPTERDLIAACSAHWSAANPSPDPAEWEAIVDADERLEVALGELYAWYAGSEDMIGNVLRDASVVEPLGEVVQSSWSPYMDRVVEVLAEGRACTEVDTAEVRAALRLVVDFRTWKVLSGSGMESGRAARLAARLVRGMA
jgi:AcrR family transcriptional regulator